MLTLLCLTVDISIVVVVWHFALLFMLGVLFGCWCVVIGGGVVYVCG